MSGGVVSYMVKSAGENKEKIRLGDSRPERRDIM